MVWSETDVARFILFLLIEAEREEKILRDMIERAEEYIEEKAATKKRLSDMLKMFP
jgi:hypothetical protein